MEHHDGPAMNTGVICDRQFVFHNYTTCIEQNDDNYNNPHRIVPSDIQSQQKYTSDVRNCLPKSNLFIKHGSMRCDSIKNGDLSPYSDHTHIMEETERKKRKGVRHEENWKRNRIKMKRNSGQCYVNWRNKEVAPRTLKPPCADHCKLKCKTKFTEVQRQHIFSNYWALGNVDHQRDFIACFVNFLKKKHNKTSIKNVNDSSSTENIRQSRRQMTYIYTLPQADESIRVCKVFFLNTLSISHQVVKTVAAKYSKSGNNVFLTDQRGKQRKEKYSDCVKNIVKQHIMEFVVIEDNQTKSSSNISDNDKEKTKKTRIRYEENWKRNKIKSMRNNGKSYINWRNKPVAERSLKPSCGDQCKLQCSVKFFETQRLQIFNDYWTLGDVNRQRFFIKRFVNFIKTKSQKRLTNLSQSLNSSSKNKESRRLFTYIYTLPRDDEIIRVCKIFFLNTLCISHQVVKTVASKCKGILTGSSRIITDQRGKRRTIQQQTKRPDGNKMRRVTKNYIPASVTITKMHTMYKKYCEDNNISTIVTPYIYKKVFTQQLNANIFVIKNKSLDDQTSSKNEKDLQPYSTGESNSSPKHFDTYCIGQNHSSTLEKKIVNNEFDHTSANISCNNLIPQNVYMEPTFAYREYHEMRDVGVEENIQNSQHSRQEGYWTHQYISY